MSKTVSNAACLLFGSIITGSLFIFVGASSPTTNDAQFDVDFDTIDLKSKQLTIEITDLKKQQAYLYVIPNPTRSTPGGNSPTIKQPPTLMATIDLKTAGNKTLDAQLKSGLLPIKLVNNPYAPNSHE